MKLGQKVIYQGKPHIVKDYNDEKAVAVITNGVGRPFQAPYDDLFEELDEEPNNEIVDPEIIYQLYGHSRKQNPGRNK